MNIQQQATDNLTSIPFGDLIGGPLAAAVEAQAHAADTTMDFINTVALEEDGSVKNVVFSYRKDDSVVRIVVPILTIVPVPYLRIDNMTVAFKAKISAETKTKIRKKRSSKTEVSAGGSVGFSMFGVNFKAGYSSKKDSTSSRDSRYNIEYTMDIEVLAVQDDLPKGLEKVLNILENSIRIRPPEGGAESLFLTITGEGDGNEIVGGKLNAPDGTAPKIRITATLYDKDGKPVADDTVVRCYVLGTTALPTAPGGDAPTNRAITANGTGKVEFEIQPAVGETVEVMLKAGLAEADGSVSIEA